MTLRVTSLTIDPFAATSIKWNPLVWKEEFESSSKKRLEIEKKAQKLSPIHPYLENHGELVDYWRLEQLRQPDPTLEQGALVVERLKELQLTSCLLMKHLLQKW